MDDRELLALAARAAGIELLDFYGERYSARIIATNKLIGWNALTDDGDALRLAVKLNLFGSPQFEHFLALERFAGQEHDDYRAYRRAIVRAASAIAQEMTNAQG